MPNQIRPQISSLVGPRHRRQRWMTMVTALTTLGAIGLTTLPVFAKFVPPRAAVPGQRRAAGSRAPDLCVQSRDTKVVNSDNAVEKLALVIPQTNIGYTTAARPQLFWYVPSNQSIRGELRIQETQPKRRADGNLGVTRVVYQASLNLTSATDRLMSHSLPATAPELAVGNIYRWSVSLYCKGSETPLVTFGFIERQPITTDSGKVLNPGPTARLDLADRAASQGLWFDALSLTYDQRCRSAAQTRQAWNGLLDDIGYGSFKTTPWPEDCPATKPPLAKPSPRPLPSAKPLAR